MAGYNWSQEGPKSHQAGGAIEEYKQNIKKYLKKCTKRAKPCDKKPKQVESWMNVFNESFGNTKLSRVYIPSFDCSWNFSSSINH